MKPRAHLDASALQSPLNGFFWSCSLLGWRGCRIWYGSNRLIAWGVNAVLFPGLRSTLRALPFGPGRAASGADQTDQALGWPVRNGGRVDFPPERNLDAHGMAASDMAARI